VPTNTAKPIIAQLIGRISRTKPLAFPMSLEPCFKEALLLTQLIKFSSKARKLALCHRQVHPHYKTANFQETQFSVKEKIFQIEPWNLKCAVFKLRREFSEGS
jgi:ABC-type siderophore export system fused ATPase/permease subunit